MLCRNRYGTCCCGQSCFFSLGRCRLGCAAGWIATGVRPTYSVDCGIHNRVFAAQVPRATLVEASLKAFLSEGSFLALLGERGWPRRAGFRVVGPDVGPLARLSLVVVDDVVVGGRGVGLCLLAFLALGDDDGAGVSPDVDDVAEIIVGVIVGLSNIFLKSIE